MIRIASTIAATALRCLALPFLLIGRAATPVLSLAQWCEARAFTPPETGRPAPTDGRAGDRR